MIINFVGDLCLQGIEPKNYRIDEEIVNLLVQGKINVANLEAPLTLSESQTPHQPLYLKAKPDRNHIIDLFDTYSLANNHILDYMKKGLKDTIAFLGKERKAWFGVGLNEKEAYMPLKITHEGFRIAFLGFTRWYNAKDSRCGTTPGNVRRLSRIVRELKAEEYFTVIYPHWNYEYVDYPSPIERKRAKKLIDAGADLIVGSHPHNVQGFEQYKGKYIFHSLGNFIFLPSIFPQKDQRLHQTFILTVRLHSDYDYSVNVTPVYANDYGLRKMEGAEEVQFMSRINELSSVFADERSYKRLFYQHATKIIDKTMSAIRLASGDRELTGIIRRVPRVQWQDVLIKLHSMFSKFGKK